MQVEVKVKVFANLRKYAAQSANPLRVDLEDGATAKELTAKIRIPHEKVRVIAVNGSNKPLDHHLSAGDQVALFSEMAGG